MRVDLTPDSWLDLEPAFLPPDEAARAFEQVRGELSPSWEQRDIVIFGRRIPQPRLVAWSGALPYRYSGQTLEPRAPTPAVAGLQARASAFAGVAFNHVLANLYRDGRELGPAPVVGTLSLGATRRFVIVPRRQSAGARRTLELPGGSLLIMGGACQAELRPGLPRDARVAAARISLTFRVVVGA